MVKFKVNKRFKDVHSGDIYEPGATVEFTLKRAKEVEKNLDKTFISRVEEPKEK